VRSESSLDGFNGGRFLSLVNSLVNLGVLVLLFGSLGLLEDLSRRGELEDRLRRRRARQVLVRVEATNRSDVSDVSQLEEVVLLAELSDAILTIVLLEVTLLVVPVLAFLVGVVALAIVVSALIVPATVLHPELFRHRRKGDALGQIR